MRKLVRRFFAAMTAVSFAEEGDPETARQIASEAGSNDQPAEPRRMRPGSHRPLVAPGA